MVSTHFFDFEIFVRSASFSSDAPTQISEMISLIFISSYYWWMQIYINSDISGINAFNTSVMNGSNEHRLLSLPIRWKFQPFDEQNVLERLTWSTTVFKNYPKLSFVLLVSQVPNNSWKCLIKTVEVTKILNFFSGIILYIRTILIDAKYRWKLIQKKNWLKSFRKYRKLHLFKS